jgi:hypothetical protein
MVQPFGITQRRLSRDVMSITWGELPSSARNGNAANCVPIFGLLFDIV